MTLEIFLLRVAIFLRKLEGKCWHMKARALEIACDHVQRLIDIAKRNAK